ncbi:MAG: hypothetical protein V1487_04560, partial [bacterium]
MKKLLSFIPGSDLLLRTLLFKRSVLKRKTWLQAKLGSPAGERTDLKGFIFSSLFTILLSCSLLSPSSAHAQEATNPSSQAGFIEHLSGAIAIQIT